MTVKNYIKRGITFSQFETPFRGRKSFGSPRNRGFSNRRITLYSLIVYASIENSNATTNTRKLYDYNWNKSRNLRSDVQDENRVSSSFQSPKLSAKGTRVHREALRSNCEHPRSEIPRGLRTLPPSWHALPPNPLTTTCTNL